MKTFHEKPHTGHGRRRHRPLAPKPLRLPYGTNLSFLEDIPINSCPEHTGDLGRLPSYSAVACQSLTHGPTSLKGPNSMHSKRTSPKIKTLVLVGNRPVSEFAWQIWWWNVILILSKGAVIKNVTFVIKKWTIAYLKQVVLSLKKMQYRFTVIDVIPNILAHV